MENRKHYLFELVSFEEKDGFLTVAEAEKQIPFKIMRIFYEYHLKNESSRGNHANKNSRFCLIALKGSCNVQVNDGENETLYRLDNPNVGLFLDKMVWKVMKNFSDDCILLVISDHLYDKNEYIRNFNEFLKLTKI